MQPKFSIILPTYNRSYVLWKAIQSVVDQTINSWELIIVDDGSTDATKRMVEEFHDPRIQYFRTTNNGPSAARNLGISKAVAPLIAYIDSDNSWDQDFLKTMSKNIRENNRDVLWYCGQITTYWERTKKGECSKIKVKETTRKQYRLKDVMALKGADTNCIVHRKEVASEIGG
jgi:glycosyltransferase involved in cell wall biosynthesis